MLAPLEVEKILILSKDAQQSVCLSRSESELKKKVYGVLERGTLLH